MPQKYFRPFFEAVYRHFLSHPAAWHVRAGSLVLSGLISGPLGRKPKGFHPLGWAGGPWALPDGKVRKIISLGASDYLLKPLRYDSVIKRLQGAAARILEWRKRSGEEIEP